LGLALALSKVQQGIVGASYEHPMKKNRMTDNVIFSFFGGALDNIKPNFTDIQE
jgi:hypothetical protein